MEYIFHNEKLTGKKLRKIFRKLLLMIYILKIKKNYPACASKHNQEGEKSSLLKILYNGKWHFFAMKKLSALLKAIIFAQSNFVMLKYPTKKISYQILLNIKNPLAHQFLFTHILNHCLINPIKPGGWGSFLPAANLNLNYF